MQLADDSRFSNDRMSRQQTTTVDTNVSNESGTETRKDEFYSGPGASPRSVSYPVFIHLYVEGLGTTHPPVKWVSVLCPGRKASGASR